MTGSLSRRNSTISSGADGTGFQISHVPGVAEGKRNSVVPHVPSHGERANRVYEIPL